MEDAQGRPVRLGDRVELWPDHFGVVVCALDDAQFSASYPASEWGHLTAGAVIEMEDGGIFHYAEPDEDFRVVRSLETGSRP